MPHVILQHCIYHNHTFDANYAPAYASQRLNIDATYDHLLFDCEVAQSVWKELFFVLDQLGHINIQQKLVSWVDIFTLIESDEAVTDIKEIIKINLIARCIYVIYVCHLNLQKAFQKRNENPIEDTQVDYMRINAVNRFRAEVESIIYMTTTYEAQLRNRQISSLRQREMQPCVNTRFTKLDARDCQLLSAIWGSMVEVTNRKLKIKPLRREPPWIPSHDLALAEERARGGGGWGGSEIQQLRTWKEVY